MIKSELCLLILVFSASAFANQTVQYIGNAKVDGKSSYFEKQTATYDDSGRPLNSTTRYESTEGKLLAEMTSDFTESLTVPSHTIKDLRSGSILGVRWEDGKIVLFHNDVKAPDKAQETRILTTRAGEGRLLVAGQGLNFYMHENIDKLKPGQVVPLRLLIPGKLDYYDFDLEVGSEQHGVIEFEIYAKNWFFRLLAPKFRARYELKTKRIVWYDGLSNISNDKGDTQVVTIDFNYL